MQPSGPLFIKKESLGRAFSGKFSEISKNTFFTEHLWTTSAIIKIMPMMIITGSVLRSRDPAYMAILNTENRPHLTYLLLKKTFQFSIWMKFLFFTLYHFYCVSITYGKANKNVSCQMWYRFCIYLMTYVHTY